MANARRRLVPRLSVVALVGLQLVSSALSAQGGLEPWQRDEDKLETGVLYTYLKSNIDGSRAGRIALYVASSDRLESFKWRQGTGRATLVTADLDWSTFSVSTFESWTLGAGDKRWLQARLTTEDGGRVQITTAGSTEHPAVEITRWPWHSYDFDFASLNYFWRHLVDAEAPVTVGISDFVPSGGSFEFKEKGPVQIEYLGRETRLGRACRHYRIDGPGLENRGGEFWASVEGGYWVEYMIDLPDESGFDSGRLRLERVERASPEQWQAFKREKLSGN